MAPIATGGRGLTASLEPAELSVEPGGSVGLELRLGGVEGPVDDLRFEVLGDAAAWSWVVPPAGPMGTGSEVVARVVVRPPRASEPPAGASPLRVKVWVRGAHTAEAVAEAELTVSPFTDLVATLEPRVATGRSGAGYELVVDNRGNMPVAVSLATSSNDALTFHLARAALVSVPGQPSRTRILVRPRRRLLRGEARAHRFSVEARPEHGRLVSAEGQMQQEPVVGGRRLAVGAVLVVVSLLGLMLAKAVRPTSHTAPQAGSEGAPGRPAVTVATATPGCVASGHLDTFVSGLTPERIHTLPPSYSFSFVRADGCTPVRFDPCQPVHYVLNAAEAPPTGAADVREAFSRLAGATGVTFVDDGMTDEVSRRGPSVPDRYPGRWAPILVVWVHELGRQGNIEVVGSGFPDRIDDALVSGTLTLNSDAVINRARSTPVPGGFGSGGGPGVGAIGAEGVTWGRVILHELAHIMGLGHTRDRDQLMYPETAEQTSHTTDYRSGDREGLRLLGREAGCLAVSPGPGAAPTPGP
jgi:hypothetical protein